MKTEPPPEPAEPEPPAPPRRRPGDETAALAERIAEKFSLQEVNDLAFELKLDAGLTGDSLENRATSLVKTALQRDMVSRLVELCRKRRPNGGF